MSFPDTFRYFFGHHSIYLLGIFGTLGKLEGTYCHTVFLDHLLSHLPMSLSHFIQNCLFCNFLFVSLGLKSGFLSLMKNMCLVESFSACYIICQSWMYWASCASKFKIKYVFLYLVMFHNQSCTFLSCSYHSGPK